MGHDTQHACCHGPGHDHDHGRGCAREHAAAAPARQPAMAVPAGALLLRIPAMDCPTEEGLIRQALEGQAQVRGLRFDLPARALSVDAPREAWAAVTAAIESAGFKTETLQAPPVHEDTALAQRREMARLIGALAVAIAAELIDYLAPDTLGWQAAGMAVAALAIALAGVAVFRKGFGALLRGQLNIHALMTVAVTGAFLIGQWPEAAMVMALYSLAELVEARSVERARNAIAGLLALAPPQAEVRQPDGAWALVDAKTVKVGARVRVKPGERFALDGRIVAGRGAVDQSPVTGESIPVDKGPGDEVFAGTINQSGSLEFEVTQPAGDTVLARIIHAVEQAQGQRAPTQRFVDRFAAIYTPAVFVIALIAAVGAPLLLGTPWLEAAYKALVLLVIACPCALVISTPVTVVSGLAAAAKRGILIKGGVFLEEARRLQVIAFDKTGTVTQGKPRLVDQAVLARGEAIGADDDVLRMAASLAGRSDHPVSQAIAVGLTQVKAVEVADFEGMAGRGVGGSVDGRQLVMGKYAWIQERGHGTPEIDAMVAEHEGQGRTVTLLADADGALALFAVADTVRPTSAQAVAELTAMGVRTVMLTGDNAGAAQAIAGEVGISEVRAQLMPQDKQQAVAELAAGGAVGMVGDGVNDAPSLAAASLGFSMGGAGTDIAKEAADVLIMGDDLRKVPETIRLSRRTHAVLWQNISLALGIKSVFMVLALFDQASMWMAVFADMGASLLVVFNGLRLLRPASFERESASAKLSR